MTPSTLDPLDLYDRPARLGRLGAQARERAFGPQVWIRPAPPQDSTAAAVVLRGDEAHELPAWPQPSELRAGDRVIVRVDAGRADRTCFVGWLHTLAAAAPAELSVAPFGADPGGMHRLWCIAAARVLLPDAVRVEARHDLIGIRLAQLAVGFGADTLSGPMKPDRVLPLAGVTRPDENTSTGLATLVRQVGLQPRATLDARGGSETSP